MVNLQKIIIHYGERFDSIQLILTDGVKSTYTPLMGGGGGGDGLTRALFQLVVSPIMDPRRQAIL